MRPVKCINCGSSDSFLNRNGRCMSCAKKKQHEVVQELHYKKGPHYEKWKKGMKKYLKKL